MPPSTDQEHTSKRRRIDDGSHAREQRHPKRSPAEQQRFSRNLHSDWKRRQRSLSPPSRVQTIERPDSPVLQENAVLIRALETHRTPPVTSSLLYRMTQEMSKENQLDVLSRLPELIQRPPRYDVEQVETATELAAALTRPYELIFASHHTGLTSTLDWTIADQIASVGNASGAAFQPARPVTEDGASTHVVGVDVMQRAFLRPHEMRPEEVGINFLDIANTSGRVFTPPAVTEADLLTRIRRQNWKGVWFGKSGAQPHIPNWFIMTKAPSCSPFHVDHAGKCTLVIGLQGEKVWHVPRGPHTTASRLFSMRGSMFAAYPQGIAGIKIGPGDCLIMAPGTPHAVTTPSDAMLVGCFFYTAEHFARSISCVRRSFDDSALCPLWDNEDISASDYTDLTMIVENLDTPGIFSSVHRDDILVEIHELLLQQSVISATGDAGTFTVNRAYTDRGPKAARQKKKMPLSHRATVTVAPIPLDTGASVADAQRAFFRACLTWWTAQNERNQAANNRASVASESPPVSSTNPTSVDGTRRDSVMSGAGDDDLIGEARVGDDN